MAKTIEEGGFFSLSEAKHKAQEKLNFKKKIQLLATVRQPSQRCGSF